MSDDTEITLIQTTRGSRSLAATVRACERDYIGRMMSPTEYNNSFASEAVGMYVYRSSLRAHNRSKCKLAMGPIGIIKFAFAKLFADLYNIQSCRTYGS